MKAEPAIRVVLADDHTLVRAGVRSLLEKLSDVEVVGEANDGREAILLADTLKPDVIVMDIGMPVLNGLEATKRLAQSGGSARVIILSMHRNEEYAWQALRAGARGYLLKSAASTELEIALRQVMRGENYLGRELSRRLVAQAPRLAAGHFKSPVEQLSGRQREILQLIAEGRNTKQIADILSLSPKTVEYHRLKLMGALGVHDIPGLVRFAIEVGFVPTNAAA